MISVTRSTVARLKIKKFGGVCKYELVMIVRQVKMFPGIPRMDIAL